MLSAYENIRLRIASLKPKKTPCCTVHEGADKHSHGASLARGSAVATAERDRRRGAQLLGRPLTSVDEGERLVGSAVEDEDEPPSARRPPVVCFHVPLVHPPHQGLHQDFVRQLAGSSPQPLFPPLCTPKVFRQSLPVSSKLFVFVFQCLDGAGLCIRRKLGGGIDCRHGLPHLLLYSPNCQPSTFPLKNKHVIRLAS